MNIAICDDDKGVCSQLEGWIEQYNYENATRLYVDVYHSAETLQQQLQTGQWYDMLFLDIELPQKNGIELGQMIRSAWKMDLIYLVFISGKSNYCMDLFDVHPLNFHLKPLKHKDVVKDIDLVRERVNTGTLAFRYREDGVYKSVCLKDVVYFVGAGKGVEVHCKDGRVAFAGNSLQQLCDIYEKHGFSRCHKSYLITVTFKKKSSDETLLGGAKMAVYDSQGNKVTEFTTKKGKKKIFTGLLKVGETYTFKEMEAPEGYELAKPVTYQIKDTKDEQIVSMVDKKLGIITTKTPKKFWEGKDSKTSPKTGYLYLIFGLLLVGLSGGTAGIMLWRKGKKYEKNK